MKGGLIHEVNNKELLGNRDKNLYTEEEKKFISLLRIEHNSILNPIGSFTYKIQKYYSDIDINQIIKIKNDDFDLMIKDLQNIIKKIIFEPLVYFSDFKAGIDNRYPDDRDKYIIRWSIPDILRGYKWLPDNKLLSLKDALKMKSIVKLDIIAFTENRFIEASTFFILEKINENGSSEFINIPNNFFEIFTNQLKEEILKYTKKDSLKYFKTVKRMFSLARVKKDYKMLQKLEPLINSNLSLLGQINADLETIELLYEKAHKLPIKEMLLTMDSISKRLSTIADIKLDYNFLINKLSNIKNSLKSGDIDISSDVIDIHDYLINVMNKETLQYMKRNKLYPIDKNYLPLA